jgi:hypothetical protein
MGKKLIKVEVMVHAEYDPATKQTKKTWAEGIFHGWGLTYIEAGGSYNANSQYIPQYVSVSGAIVELLDGTITCATVDCVKFFREE